MGERWRNPKIRWNPDKGQRGQTLQRTTVGGLSGLETSRGTVVAVAASMTWLNRWIAGNGCLEELSGSMYGCVIEQEKIECRAAFEWHGGI